ncbi:MAG TPA: PKD domain-containing protein [Thermoguttaceae bacterium]|nr:PKD domain-containing protein [Thermoguttaceae bacterium]
MRTFFPMITAAVLAAGCPVGPLFAGALNGPDAASLVRTIDLNVGEERTVELADGATVRLKLLGVKERRDTIRGALREAMVRVELNGRPVTLSAGAYHLPRTIGGAQIDCPVTKGFVQKGRNPWSLDRDARFRLWPKGSPWIEPGTFGYPLNQRWFAGRTQMANEIADDERVERKVFYYHWGLDFGGAEGLVDVLAATDGTVVSVAGKKLGPGPYPGTFQPRYDVVYVRDNRGWYYRYSHLKSIDPAVKLGVRVKRGQKLGTLGKEGTSGGWSHLHFDVSRPQPSGRYGIDDAYAFVWQAYQREHPTKLVAVARPHELAGVDEPVTLDAGRSHGEPGEEGLRYQWTFDDGATADGPRVTRRYPRPGYYRETVKVTDAAGRVAYDFAGVVVLDRKNPQRRPPNVHAAYWPTLDIRPGDRVTFKAVTRDVGEGVEVWDFGDGSPTVTTQSKAKPPTYAATEHVYEKPGDYLVAVRRTNARGESGVDRLHVRVEP